MRRWLLGLGLLVASAVVLPAGAGCSEDEEQPVSPSPTESVSSTSSPSPAAPTATAGPVQLRGSEIIFVRQQATLGYGTLFAVALDGSGLTELAPGEETSFVGLDTTASGSVVVYYVAKLDSASFRLRSRDSATGEVRDFMDLAWDRDYFGPSGSLDPDARYIAVDHAEGVDVVDVTKGSSNRLVSNDFSGCNPPDLDLSRCESFRSSEWSPDGRWLTLSHGFYEGSRIEIIDPASGAMIASLPGYQVAWSDSSGSVCHSQSAGLDQGGFYLSAGPEWRSEQVFGLDNPSDSYEGCVWLDDTRVAFLVVGQYADLPWRIGILEAGTRETRILSSGSAPPRPEGLFLTDGPGLIHNVVVDTTDPAVKKYGQPQLIDIISGSSAPILEPGDVVVAVVP